MLPPFHDIRRFTSCSDQVKTIQIYIDTPKIGVSLIDFPLPSSSPGRRPTPRARSTFPACSSPRFPGDAPSAPLALLPLVQGITPTSALLLAQSVVAPPALLLMGVGDLVCCGSSKVLLDAGKSQHLATSAICNSNTSPASPCCLRCSCSPNT
jgi:hypothetical protein